MPKNLLLPGAKSAILLEKPRTPFSPWWHRLAILGGIIAIVIGGGDVLARLANQLSFDESMAFTAFAPAVLLDPLIQQEVQGISVEPFVPTRVVISSIGVDAQVESVGKTAEGAMSTPKALANLGWYSLGAKPGASGNAVFAGHVNNSLGFRGVFKELSKIKEGDTVEVRGAGGAKLTYTVESITSYKENEAPLRDIFANSGSPGVALITCEGEWDEATSTFDNRLVVVARLVNP